MSIPQAVVPARCKLAERRVNFVLADQGEPTSQRPNPPALFDGAPLDKSPDAPLKCAHGTEESEIAVKHRKHCALRRMLERAVVHACRGYEENIVSEEPSDEQLALIHVRARHTTRLWC